MMFPPDQIADAMTLMTMLGLGVAILAWSPAAFMVWLCVSAAYATVGRKRGDG